MTPTIGSRWRRFGALMLLIWLCAAAPSHAAMTANERLVATQKGVAYLIFRQNGNGSWGVDNAEQLRATNQALWALQGFGVSGIPFNRALSWVYNAQAQSPDATAKLLLTLAQAKVVAPVVSAQLNRMSYDFKVNQLTIKQWGALPNYTPTVLDDIYALEAILLKKFAVDSEVVNYWTILEGVRNTAGGAAGNGWGYALSESYGAADSRKSAIIPTAEALLAMHKMALVGASASYWKMPIADQSIDWMISKQNTDGGFGDGAQSGILSTALVVQALSAAQYWDPGASQCQNTGAAGRRQVAIDRALDYLKVLQQPNGSWLNDVFTTSMVSLAMQSHLCFTTADGDQDGIPDGLETLLASGQLGYSAPLNPSVSDAYLLERGNGLNFRDLPSGLSITMDFIVGKYDSHTFDIPSAPLGVTSSGDWPAGMKFDKQSVTVSGAPQRSGVYSVSLQLDYGPNANLFVPVTIYVVNGEDDLDGDGLTNAMEHQYSNYFNPLDGTDADKDTDGDGVPDRFEVITGFPSDPLKFPAYITSVPAKEVQAEKLYTYTVTTNISTPLFVAIKPTGSTWTAATKTLTWTPTATQIGTSNQLRIQTVSPAGNTVQTAYIKVVAGGDGDINADGRVDISDVYLLQQYLLGAASLTSTQRVHADVSQVGSGASPSIDIADLYALENKVLDRTNP